MLTVEIYSFSFKKGYPEANAENGGGFVFDCRYLENPGRYEPYKQLTGRDEAVKIFLKERSAIGPFLENAWRIIDEAVENYISRDFSSLQVSFGCTGGQHRSVYSADETARHLREKYPEIGVVVIHREQDFR